MTLSDQGWPSPEYQIVLRCFQSFPYIYLWKHRMSSAQDQYHLFASVDMLSINRHKIFMEWHSVIRQENRNIIIPTLAGG